MNLALLVRVAVLSVISRISNFLHRQLVFASAMGVIDEMYETTRLEHQRYSHLPLPGFPQGKAAITTTTPNTPITTTTTTIATTTDRPTYTTTPHGERTRPSTSKPPRECDWLLVHNLGKALEAPYNLTSKTEATVLRQAVSEARTSRRTLARIAQMRPKQAGHASALAEALEYLVSAPLESSCAAVLDLQRSLLQHAQSGRNETDAAGLRPLFDDALAKLSRPAIGTRIPPRPGVLTARAREALSLVFAERWGQAKYCFGNDCDWPVRIFEMWQAAQAMRETLMAGLLDAKAQALPSFAGENGKRPLSSVLTEMAVLMPLCIVLMVLARLAAPVPVR